MRFRILLTLLILPALTGAETRCASVERKAPQEAPKLAVIDSVFTRPCPPLTIGHIPKGDQELLLVLDPIREDLENYRLCRYRHGKLVEAIEAVYRNQSAGLR